MFAVKKTYMLMLLHDFFRGNILSLNDSFLMFLLSPQMKWTMAHLAQCQPLSFDTDLKSDKGPVRLQLTKILKRDRTAAVHCN